MTGTGNPMNANHVASTGVIKIIISSPHLLTLSSGPKLPPPDFLKNPGDGEIESCRRTPSDKIAGRT